MQVLFCVVLCFLVCGITCLVLPCSLYLCFSALFSILITTRGEERACLFNPQGLFAITFQIVSVPDHCISFYFLYVSHAFVCLSSMHYFLAHLS